MPTPTPTSMPIKLRDYFKRPMKHVFSRVFGEVITLAGLGLLIVSLGVSTQSYGLGEAVDFENQTVTIALGAEPPSLNSMKSTDSVSFFILGHTNEGLLTYNKRNKLVPGVAEKWEIDANGAKFWLRKDAQWSDGKPVTAHDFVFAWRNAVDPKTASQYAFIMYPLKNAEAINSGKMTTDQLGVTAVDDYTLEIQFEKPCGYFLSLTAFGTYYPVREDFFKAQGQRYAADDKNLLFNGPFILSNWVHGASLKLVKNQHYWNKEKVTLNEIDVPYITPDSQSLFNLFKDGKIARTGLDSETLNNALEERFKIKKFSDGAVFYMEFNFRKERVTSNKNLRKALQLVFDPNELVDKVIAVPGVLAGRSLFPVWLKGVDGKFRDEYPAEVIAVNIAQAKKHLALAKKELGVTELPAIILLSGDSPTASKEAEYFQNMLKTTLGIELKIDKQNFKQRLAKMTSGDFDMVAAGWGPDFDDPMTFADLFASWNENNRGLYKNDQYDHWIRVAQNSADPNVRMDAMAKVQAIIIEDVAVLPKYESGSVYVQSPQLKGVARRVVGADPSFVYAKVTAKATSKVSQKK